MTLEPPAIPTGSKISTDTSLAELEDLIKNGAEREIKKRARLDDVSGGDATGDVTLSQDGETYILEGVFSELPALEKDYFYEGWLVQQEPFSFISTGELVSLGSMEYSNEYSSNADLEVYTSYVLTLEPDDGDPAPADHILDGELETIRK